MQYLNGGYSPAGYPAPATQDAFFGDWRTQMAITEASRRLSRGSSTGPRPGSAVGRVTKPSSASNSPTASMVSGRRRMMVGAGHNYLRPHLDHQASLRIDGAGRYSRPVSWHPGSYLPTPQPYAHYPSSCYPLSNTPIYSDHGETSALYPPQLSPMLTAYSNNVSPCSSFSPLPMGLRTHDGPQYPSQDGWEAHQCSTPYFAPAADGAHPYHEATPSLIHAQGLNTPSDQALDWNPYIMQGLASTSPPTPDSFIHQEQTQPAVTQGAIPYEPLEETEEEGEILVGMGLYDTPEKQEADPQLNNYRATASSLLGSAYRSLEPTGKGLTLEEAWEPPPSDDEEDEEADAAASA